MIKPWMYKSGRAWLSGWTYRKPVTLSRASGAVTNYQMKLSVAESSTVGSELVTNGNCESATGWSGSNGTFAIIAGGQSGNCFELTRTGSTEQAIYRATAAVVVGKRYTATLYVKSGSSGNESGGIYLDDTVGYLGASYITTSTTWTQVSATFVPTRTTVNIYGVKRTATAGTMLFDAFSMYEVGDVDCGGHVAADFDDLRFTKSDGTTLLDYWIESVTGPTPNQLATVWVEFDSIGTGATTFYMYYGNSGASTYSNISNTFIQGDNFEWGANGDNINTSGGGLTWTVSAGAVTISTTQAFSGTRSMKCINSYAYVTLTPSIDQAINFRFWKPNAMDTWFCLHGDAAHRIYLLAEVDEDISAWNGSSYVDTTLNVTADSWNQIEINNINLTGHTFDLVVNGTKKTPVAVDATAAWLNKLTLGCPAGSVSTYFDNYFVRNWRATEPAWGSWGAQEE